MTQKKLVYHVSIELEHEKCRFLKIYKGNYVTVDRKILCLCGYLEFFNFALKYRSTSEAHSSGPIHDTELMMAI